MYHQSDPRQGNAAWVTLAAIVLAISFFAGPVLASVLSFWSAF